MMNVIVPYWQGRISPLFDAAGIVLLVEVEDNRVVRRTTYSLHSDDVLQRVRQTIGLGADILICGGISGPLERMLRATGLEVIPNICGLVDDVLNAYVRGALFDTQFLLPGCFNSRRRVRNHHGR